MTKQQNSNIPAIECTLSGGYLIEASAGTGKTWTLTGILLRLLIEKKYPPERIIATTFTRNSAQEMQERLQSRLNEFYHYILWLQSQKQFYPDWFLVSSDDKSIDDIITQISQRAGDDGIDGYDDMINLHLIAHLLMEDNPKAFDFALLRTSFLLSTLDKLFIGTLDSLAQKWLKEFSSETSYQPDTVINMNDEEIIASLVHDELRREHSFMATHSPRLYQMLDPKLFTDTKPVMESIGVALQFYNAPIDELEAVNDATLVQLDEELYQLMGGDFTVFEPYYDIEYASTFGLKKNNFSKGFYHLKKILAMIKQYGSNFRCHLNDEEVKFILEIEKLNDIDKLFKDKHEQNKYLFCQLPIDNLKKIHEIYIKIKQLTKDYQHYFYRQIAINIKEKLKNSLEDKRQSTFVYQMVKLNEALANNPSLARHIRHLYPVALIDESQDINGLQAEMIGYVYLNPLKKEIQKNKKPRGFLLLVGDPKQAIYLFRGSDVANYNMIKYTKAIKDNQEVMVLNQSLSLNENRRSHQGLIDILNTWFCQVQDKDKHNHASLGSNIYYQDIIATNHEQKLSWQLCQKDLPDYLSHHAISVLYFNNAEEGVDIYQSVAWHINSLLQDGHTITKDNHTRAIMPTDIAILSRNYTDLYPMKEALGNIGISAISPKEINVFTTQSAKDLYYLLSLMTDAINHKRLSMVLMSPLFGLSYQDSMALLNENTDAYNRLLVYFNRARMILTHQGITSAINDCLSKNPLKSLRQFNQKETLWEQIATQGERYMADLSQVIELIGAREHGFNHHHSQFMAWFLSMTEGRDKKETYYQLPLPSESGVTLMTIHKSKGLEFPIVYIFGLNTASKSDEMGFYPYSDKDYVRRLSPTPHGDEVMDFYKQKRTQEGIEEEKRLGYVALTRASEQVFVIAKEVKAEKNKDHRPLRLWFECANKNPIELPDRLSKKVGWIAMNEIHQLNTTPYKKHQERSADMIYDDWHDVFAQSHFYAEHSTSATDMMQSIDKSQNHPLVNDEDIYINLNTYHHENISYQENDIRLSFIKGKEGGTFLHHILKYAEGDNISETINKVAKSLGFNHYVNKSLHYEQISQIHEQNHTALAHWIDDILSTPMMASSVSLKSLPRQYYAKEMGFSLGIHPSFHPNQINQLFYEHTDKRIDMTNDDVNVYYKYLNGEIDLVYEYGGKFYIVDYKSNFISTQLADYHEDILNVAMNEAGYWLQACIYQVALHRLLAIRIPKYLGNEQHYLGGVEFVFLRGVDRQYPALGHIHWQIPVPMILALDELLGKYYT